MWKNAQNLDYSRQFCRNMFDRNNSNKKYAKMLGVIRLDDYPLYCEGGRYNPVPGDIDAAQSFCYPVKYAIAKDCTFKNLCNPQSFLFNEHLKKQMEDGIKKAIQTLEDAGCTAITSDCGLFIWMQQFAREQTQKQIIMSPLVFLSSMLQSSGQKNKIAIFTSKGKSIRYLLKSKHMNKFLLGYRKRLIIVGCDEQKYGIVDGFEAIEAGDTVDVKKVKIGIRNVARNVLKKHPDVKAILVECTEMPAYSDSIREETNLPVFDAITVCDQLMAGFLMQRFSSRPRITSKNIIFQ